MPYCLAGFIAEAACLLEGSAARKHEEGASAVAGPAEADGCAELLLRFGHAGIIKGELLARVHMPQRVHCDGQAAAAGHDHCLAVGSAAVAHPARKGALQPRIFVLSSTSQVETSS